jgi:hypothetical protein
MPALRDLDQFGVKYSNFIGVNGKNEKKTTFGGCVSVLAYLIVAAAAFGYTLKLVGPPDFN